MASILVVDDHLAVCILLKRLLVRLDHQVEVADSGEEALPMLDTKHFDLLIVDKNMPGMSGHEVIKVVRATQPGIKIVLMTAFPNPDDLVLEGRLMKPFSISEVNALMVKVLG